MFLALRLRVFSSVIIIMVETCPRARAREKNISCQTSKVKALTEQRSVFIIFLLLLNNASVREPSRDKRINCGSAFAAINKHKGATP